MLEESSGILQESPTKKRRRRKKKPNTQNLEKDEHSNDGNKGKEYCDAERTECKVKVKKKNKRADVNKIKGENNKASSRVDVTSDVSWTVKEVKEVDSIAGCSEKPVLNAVCLVLNENTNCRDKKQLSGKSRRNVNKAGDTSVKDLEKNTSNSFNSGTTRPTSFNKPNKEQSVITGNHKNNKCQTDDNRESELKMNDCGNSDSNRSVPEQTPCQKSRTKRSINGREHEDMEYKADDNAGYTENCGETQFFGHSPEGTACNEGNPDASAAFNHRRRSSTSRRSSFDRSSEKGARDSNLPENHRHHPTTDRRRRRSRDCSQQKEPREEYSTAKPGGILTFNPTSTNDLRESESSETYRYPTDNRRIESTDEIIKHDPSGDEYRETHRNPAKHQKRRGSWGRSPRNSRSEQSENNYFTENSSRRRSFGRTSESDAMGREDSYRHFNNNRRRRACSDSGSDNHGGRSELPENHCYHPSENRSRRRSFDRTSKNEQPYCPTNKISLSESGNLSECEERKPEALVEQSSGMSFQSPPKSICIE